MNAPVVLSGLRNVHLHPNGKFPRLQSLCHRNFVRSVLVGPAIRNLECVTTVVASQNHLAVHAAAVPALVVQLVFRLMGIRSVFEQSFCDEHEFVFNMASAGQARFLGSKVSFRERWRSRRRPCRPSEIRSSSARTFRQESTPCKPSTSISAQYRRASRRLPPRPRRTFPRSHRSAEGNVGGIIGWPSLATLLSDPSRHNQNAKTDVVRKYVGSRARSKSDFDFSIVC